MLSTSLFINFKIFLKLNLVRLESLLEKTSNILAIKSQITNPIKINLSLIKLHDSIVLNTKYIKYKELQLYCY